MIENMTTQANLTIENSKFIKTNTHIRIQTRGRSIIKNCYLESRILLSGDTSYWFESSPVNDLTFENCTFATHHGTVESIPEILPTKDSPYYHENVTFKNCSFEAERFMNMSFTNNIVIENTVCANGERLKGYFTNCYNIKADENCDIEERTIEKTTLSTN